MDKDIEKALRDLPGSQIDSADDNKATEQEVKQDVRELNNNPRNTDGPCPGNA